MLTVDQMMAQAKERIRHAEAEVLKHRHKAQVSAEMFERLIKLQQPQGGPGYGRMMNDILKRMKLDPNRFWHVSDFVDLFAAMPNARHHILDALGRLVDENKIHIQQQSYVYGQKKELAKPYQGIIKEKDDEIKELKATLDKYRKVLEKVALLDDPTPTDMQEVINMATEVLEWDE